MTSLAEIVRTFDNAFASRPDKARALTADEWATIKAALPVEPEVALPPQFTVCGTCQRKATVTSRADFKMIGIVCERTDCPGRPALNQQAEPEADFDPLVQCSCGWSGTSSQLRPGTLGVGKICPKCANKFHTL